MCVQTYLFNRKGVYYCRVPIPTHLQAQIGKKEVWKRLGTRSYIEAIQHVKFVTSEIVVKWLPFSGQILYKDFN